MSTAPDLTSMDDDDLESLHGAVMADLEMLRVTALAEQERRWRLANLEREISESITQLLIAQGRTQGTAWVQPIGAHDAYPSGWQVTHDGHLWRSQRDGNVWPPATGPYWEDLGPGTPATPPPAPEWAPDTAYAAGDPASFEGIVYVCAQPHTSQPGWTPVAVPALWTQA